MPRGRVFGRRYAATSKIRGHSLQPLRDKSAACWELLARKGAGERKVSTHPSACTPCLRPVRPEHLKIDGLSHSIGVVPEKSFNESSSWRREHALAGRALRHILSRTRSPGHGKVRRRTRAGAGGHTGIGQCDCAAKRPERGHPSRRCAEACAARRAASHKGRPSCVPLPQGRICAAGCLSMVSVRR